MKGLSQARNKSAVLGVATDHIAEHRLRAEVKTSFRNRTVAKLSFYRERGRAALYSWLCLISCVNENHVIFCEDIQFQITGNENHCAKGICQDNFPDETAFLPYLVGLLLPHWWGKLTVSGSLTWALVACFLLRATGIAGMIVWDVLQDSELSNARNHFCEPAVGSDIDPLEVWRRSTLCVPDWLLAFTTGTANKPVTEPVLFKQAWWSFLRQIKTTDMVNHFRLPPRSKPVHEK